MESSQIDNIYKNCKDRGILGNLTRVPKFNDEPNFSQWTCQNSANSEEGGISTDLTDSRAKLKAIAESIERYFSSAPNKSELSNKSYDEIPERALSPSELCLLADSGEGCSFLNQEKFSWVEGIQEKTKQPIKIPSQAVYTSLPEKEKLFMMPISTGTAFGFNRESTLERAVAEVIERDTFMRSWLENSIIRTNPSTEIKPLIDYFHRYLLEPIILKAGTLTGNDISVAFLFDKTGEGPGVSCGVGYSTTRKNSELKALLEAQQVRAWLRFLNAKEQGLKIESEEQIYDFKSRGFYWYSQERSELLKKILNNLPTESNKIKFKARNKKRTLQELYSLGFEAYSVDLVPEEFKGMGFHVIKTIIPGMLPLKVSEQLPYFPKGIKSLKSALNKLPHPFL